MVIVKIPYINPINDYEEYIKIDLDIDYSFYKNINQLYNDSEITKHLDYLLKCTDCTIIYNCGANCVLNSYVYELKFKEYYYFLLKIKNHFIYNQYYNKLIQHHIKNIEFEYNKPKTPIKKEKIKSNKTKVLNKFIRQETTNLFTGEKTYQYVNQKTNEIIISSDGNLLETLNNKEKKKKKESKVVSMSGIIFNFKKK